MSLPPDSRLAVAAGYVIATQRLRYLTYASLARSDAPFRRIDFPDRSHGGSSCAAILPSVLFSP